MAGTATGAEAGTVAGTVTGARDRGRDWGPPRATVGQAQPGREFLSASASSAASPEPLTERGSVT